MKKREPKECEKDSSKMDYFSLAFPEFANFFELSLYGPGDLTRDQSATPEKAGKAFRGILQGKSLLVPHQVHGKRILFPSENSDLSFFPEGDGIFLQDPSWRGMLRFADCCPVIVFSAEPSPWMLMLHMGFRGALEGIPLEGWRVLQDRFPSLDTGRCRAFVGPAIRGCCYFRKREDPLTSRGMALFPWEFWKIREEECFFDLPRMGAYMLGRIGIEKKHIFLVEECVHCGSSGWYSYRRGDAENRNVLLGGIRK
ncbi:MAG TPA: polyphenol oxidase family protein [Synergistaceae bacterium]|nr:polyphenol oxidase family protein [Synergistaceae bacterium]HPJ25095.1 polyphenol oxidase family protein [Synergistaceae bacterium]HPQ36574.1 polyphenol oxidase family protein [Synergistaceae bacterium]